MNADFVVAGHITRLGDRNLVLITIVNVESFQQIAGVYREYKEIGEIRGYLPEMAKKLGAASRVDTSRLPKLAVLPFAIPAGVNAQDAEVLAQLLATEVANSGKYAVLPRTKTIETVMTEQKIQRTGLTDPDTVKAIGRATNARYVLSGNVLKLGANMNLFLVQILNIEDASLLTGGDVEYTAMADGLKLMPELSAALTGVQAGTGAAVPQGLVFVEGGSFQMGGSGEYDGRPIHTVTVRSFYMGKYEVTQKEWIAVMGTNPSNFKGDNLPVENLSWFEAVEYCNKLSLKEGLTPAYRGSGDGISCNFTANGYRLPREMFIL
jgi:formylglycine-generating enzyme required for sulfatase activity